MHESEVRNVYGKRKKEIFSLKSRNIFADNGSIPCQRLPKKNCILLAHVEHTTNEPFVF